MAFKPTKTIHCNSITNVSTNSTMEVNGVVDIPYKWDATLNVTPQSHSDPSSLPEPYFYTGDNINVGDWISTDANGTTVQISSITSHNANQVVCVLEDAYNANYLTNSSGDGMIPNGPGIEGFIFEVKNNTPIIGSIPSALSGNLSGSSFISNIQSRFLAIAPPPAMNATTGKIESVALPAPVISAVAGESTPGAVLITPTSSFNLEPTTGELLLKPATTTSVGGIKLPSSNSPIVIDPITSEISLSKSIMDAIANGGNGSGNSSTIKWSTITTDSTITAGSHVLVDTTSHPLTITLPSTPGLNDSVSIIDYSGTASINNITITHSSKVLNSTEPLILDMDNARITLLYTGDTNGWVMSTPVFGVNVNSVWMTKNSNYTSSTGDLINADTSVGIFTVTLPLIPLADDIVVINDYLGTFSTHNLTINGNGHKILSSTDDLVLDVSFTTITLIYTDSIRGWVLG